MRVVTWKTTIEFTAIRGSVIIVPRSIPSMQMKPLCIDGILPWELAMIPTVWI
jgi:hypothetical protein